ncbi:MAG: helix-turn-helix domain-containing protein [Candidatus Latescibacteria bacterium]|nr:helix-turn-helix domain-containing protein [Candidatus Latescibacterota bacterium]
MDEKSKFGWRLRQAREEQGKTLEQVHRHTGLSLFILQNLEAGAFAVVEPVYIRLALRSYAEHLGLNPAALVQQLDALWAPPPPPVQARPAPRPHSWMRRLALGLSR